MNKLDQLLHVRILLQEILQGYDNSQYRLRAFFALLHAGVPYDDCVGWKNNCIPTLRMLERVNGLIDAACKD